MSAPLDADVVIIGSGVAGSLIAWRLAEAKLKVLILEAGPRIDRVEAFKSYLAARDKNASAPYPPAPYAPAPQYNAWNDYYINTGPDLFRGMYTRGVGGSTWHWAGSVLRYRPSDFRMKSRFGVGVDWPISYEELAPFYDEAERVLGVAGSNTESWGAPRASEYPMPAIPPSYLDTVVGGVLGPLGMSLSVFPQARNSVLYDERPQCCGNASCVPLCPIGAKYDASFHATKAEKAGARLETGAVVHRIEMDANHVASATVHFRRPDGSEGTAVGRMVVLAAHAIETPKLLLMSRDERTPKGVANSSDTVGRYLMSHIDQGTRGLTGAPIYPYRGPVITSAIREFRDGAFRQNHSAIGTSISNEGWRHLGPQATANALIDQGLAGQRLKNAIAWRTERELTLGSTAETLPDPANRIVPDETRTDAIGIPRPRIHYRIDDYAKAGLALAMRRHEAIFAALQSTEIETLPMVTSSGTILGTTRMGNDPRDSVVDRDLRAHDHANLFIVGGMVFPTAGMHPPTLTIAALALRAALLIQQGFAGQH